MKYKRTEKRTPLGWIFARARVCVGVWGRERGWEWSAKSSPPPSHWCNRVPQHRVSYLFACVSVFVYVCVWERFAHTVSKLGQRERESSVGRRIEYFFLASKAYGLFTQLFPLFLFLLVTTIRNLDSSSSGVVLRAYVCKLPLTGSCIGLFSFCAFFNVPPLWRAQTCARARSRYIFPRKIFCQKDVFTLSELHFHFFGRSIFLDVFRFKKCF